jgi:hypothetical protein
MENDKEEVKIFYEPTGDFHYDGEFEVSVPPRPVWSINITGDFILLTSCKISLWQRLWMRFMGWTVKRVDK